MVQGTCPHCMKLVPNIMKRIVHEIHTSTHVDSSHSQPDSAVFETLTEDDDIESDDGVEESEEESDTKQQIKTSDQEIL